MIINKLAKFLPLLAILLAEPTFATSNYRSSESLYRSPALQPTKIAQSTCLKWDVEIPFRIIQDNGWENEINIQLANNRNPYGTWQISGTAISWAKNYNRSYQRNLGTVKVGSHGGSKLYMSIPWDNNTTGYYEGTIDSNGKMTGYTFDEINDPSGSNKVAWHATRGFGCVDRVAR
jgi:hypothetical protein